MTKRTSRKRPCHTIVAKDGKIRACPAHDAVLTGDIKFAITVLDNRSFGRYALMAKAAL